MSDVKQEAPYISRMATAAGAGDAGAFTKDAGQAEQIVKDARQALVGQGFAHCGQGH